MLCTLFSLRLEKVCWPQANKLLLLLLLSAFLLIVTAKTLYATPTLKLIKNVN